MYVRICMCEEEDEVLSTVDGSWVGFVDFDEVCYGSVCLCLRLC